VDGYNPVGALTAPTVGASPWAYTNDTNIPVALYLSGGDITALSLNGTATATFASPLQLEPGQTVKITYSTAPNVALIGA